ncbi:Protein phosphatase 1J [Turdus rufiventris]|nr:Protein phosphatase 1J [Turdus rufiventris]
MLLRVRAAVAQLAAGLGAQPPAEPRGGGAGAGRGSPPPAAFCRPAFLQLTPEELRRADDHTGRAVQSPRDSRCRLPWSTGYAEFCNLDLKSAMSAQAGKSQGESFCKSSAGLIITFSPPSLSPLFPPRDDVTWGRKGFYFHYWALFDGHAGSGAAVMASERLHLHICEQLRDLVEILQDPSPPPICLPPDTRTGSADPNQVSYTEDHGEVPNDAVPRFHLEKAVSHESLVIGAIENAFKRMDDQIEQERASQHLAGGCCALAAIYLMGKFYVANAGDSRAIIIRNGEIIPMSREFTPETERQRLQFLALLRPELLGKEFTHLEFPRRIQPKELGKKMLYRDQNMNGWAYKKIEEDDLKFPLIFGEGKKARMMATIGVTRGLGDHDLKVFSSNIHIKPFLSCFPEVRVYDLTQYEHCPDDVLVLGTDGLWDVTNDKEVAGVVMEVLTSYEPNDPCRYTMVAQELVVRSRGVLKERGWRLANDKLGSGDDISVFVIPLGGPGNYT